MVGNSIHKLWNNEWCIITIVLWLWYLNVIASKETPNFHRNLMPQLVESSLEQLIKFQPFKIFIALILQLLFDDS